MVYCLKILANSIIGFNANGGNRTRVLCLGSRCFTTKLRSQKRDPRKIYLLRSLFFGTTILPLNYTRILFEQPLNTLPEPR